jgi:DNA modification methylase
MAEMGAESVDSIVCDPPYGLAFMGKEWDHGVPGAAFWREALRVAKPGAHLLAFGGSRTYHRLACAVEDAGWDIRDQILWLYGSGFPKSLDVGKAIDKANGKHDRDLSPFAVYVKSRRIAKGLSLAALDRLMGTNTAASWWEGRSRGIQPPGVATYHRLKAVLALDDRFDELIEWLEAEREVVGSADKPKGHSFAGERFTKLQGSHAVDITTPATDAAKRWHGFGTALKPAHEPIVLARKPLTGTVAANVCEHGTGALNIDGCRVGAGGGTKRTTNPKHEGRVGMADFTRGNFGVTDIGRGRWPANIIFDEEAAAMLDEQTGGASRFFYCAKAGKKERGEGNVHPTVKPVALMRYLLRLVTPPGGLVLDPFAGSGTTVLAAVDEGFDCIGIEKEPEYAKIAAARLLAHQVDALLS